MAWLAAGAFLLIFVGALAFASLAGMWRMLRSFLVHDDRAAHPEIDQPDVIVTLVHGTFARDAPWTLPGSMLCDGLQAALGDQAAISSFNWSGRNSISARQKGSVALGAALNERIRAHPGARHYVIGHSHGGSVIMGALDPGLASRIDGIICLATPFLNIHERPRRGSAGVALFFVPLILSAWGLMALNGRLGWLGEDTEPLIVFAALAIAWGVAKRIKAEVGRMAQDTDLSFLDPHRLLLIRAPGDEATNAIGAAHLLSTAFGALSMLPVRLFDHVQVVTESWRGAVLRHRARAAVLALLLLAASVFWVIGVVSDGISNDALFLFGGLCLLTLAGLIGLISRGGLYAFFVVHMVMAIVLIPFALVAGVLGLLFIGPELTLTALLLEVSAETCPPGTWRVTQLPHEERAGLRHSQPYQSEAALRVILAFLAERRRGAGRSLHGLASLSLTPRAVRP